MRQLIPHWPAVRNAVWAGSAHRAGGKCPALCLIRERYWSPSQKDGTTKEPDSRLLSLFTPMRRHPPRTLTGHYSSRVNPRTISKKNILTCILQLNLVSVLKWLSLAQLSIYDAEELAFKEAMQRMGCSVRMQFPSGMPGAAGREIKMHYAYISEMPCQGIRLQQQGVFWWLVSHWHCLWNAYAS